jgi:alpha-beta hydrolase superfamily lysophospholipase
MKLDSERFPATDGLELQGWYSDATNQPNTALATLHVHGFAGDGHTNRFLDSLRLAYADAGTSFFSFDTRGSSAIGWSNRNGQAVTIGSKYETFPDSIHDIQGAAQVVKERGAQQLIIQGHSLGTSKVVNYCLNREERNALPIAGVVLLSPVNMPRWAAQQDPKHHQEYLDKAYTLLDEGKPTAHLVDEWAYGTPISAQAYVSLSEKGGAVDVYSPRGLGPHSALLSKLVIPTLIVCGGQDEAIQQTHGDIYEWERDMRTIAPSNSEIHIINGATHGFEGYEQELASIVGEFAGRIALGQ